MQANCLVRVIQVERDLWHLYSNAQLKAGPVWVSSDYLWGWRIPQPLWASIPVFAHHLCEQFIVSFLVATCACCHSSYYYPSMKSLAPSSLITGARRRPHPLSFLLPTLNKACSQILPGFPVTSLTYPAGVYQKVWLIQLKQFRTKKEKDHYHLLHVTSRRQAQKTIVTLNKQHIPTRCCIHK